MLRRARRRYLASSLRSVAAASSLLACAAFSLGCGGGTDGSGGGGSAPTTQHVDGAPTTGNEPARTAVMMTAATPKTLGVLAGGLAIGADDGLYAAKLGDNSFEVVPAVDDDGNFIDTGAVRHLTRRDGGGILVDAALGLFDDDRGILLKSPLDGTLDASAIDAMSAVGTDTAEELWVLSKGKVIHIADGKLADVSISDMGAVDTTFAAAVGQGVIVSGDKGWFVDVGTSEATDFASDLGHVYAGDHGEDGSVVLGSDAGLVVRDRSGNVTYYSLAASGQHAEKVIAVSSAYGAVFAATATSLIAITSKGPELLAKPDAPVVALATDANGDLWSLEGDKIYHHATGAPVSFAKDVVPFIKQHCASCHQTGQNGAPKLDYENYDIAKKYASLMVTRLGAAPNEGVMPPVTAETLTAEDYAVVTRWVASGLSP